jgi:hypothetical protein
MMKPLRKRHLQIWIISALLLPAGIIFVWLAIPNQQPVQLLQTPGVALLPVINQARNFNNYTVTLRTNYDRTRWQLEWKNTTPLKVPSAVIYRVQGQAPGETTAPPPFKPANAELIGRIETRGNYIFPLTHDTLIQSPLHLILYDFIHEKVIDSINFKP